MELKRRLTRLLGLSQPRSLPGTQSLAQVMNAPQTPAQSLCGSELYDDPSCPVPNCSLGCTGDPFDPTPCRSDCDDLLSPRAERCSEAQCQAGLPCWRCDYEESSHTCYDKDGRTC